MFSVNSGVNFTVKNLTIANGTALSGDAYGGGISNNGGTLTVTNSTFTGNQRVAVGGAVATSAASAAASSTAARHADRHQQHLHRQSAPSPAAPSRQ